MLTSLVLPREDYARYSAILDGAHIRFSTPKCRENLPLLRSGKSTSPASTSYISGFLIFFPHTRSSVCFFTLQKFIQKSELWSQSQAHPLPNWEFVLLYLPLLSASIPFRFFWLLKFYFFANSVARNWSSLQGFDADQLNCLICWFSSEIESYIL